MDPRHHSVRFPMPYSWVATKEEMIMLEKYSNIWTEKDYKDCKNYPNFDGERCNAIQLLVRARLLLDTNVYLMNIIDFIFCQYLAPVAGYKHCIKSTGLAEDPLRHNKAKPNKDADIVQMLMAAKQRYDEQTADAAVQDAEAPHTANNCYFIEGTWQEWEVAVLDDFIHYRKYMVSY